MSSVLAAWITLGISLLSILLGGAVVWGKVKRQLTDHEKYIADLKGGLYNKDGSLVYVPEKVCNTRRNDFCAKVDEIKGMIRELSSKIDQNQRGAQEEFKNIAGFMGEVSQFMKDQRAKNG